MQFLPPLLYLLTKGLVMETAEEADMINNHPIKEDW